MARGTVYQRNGTWTIGFTVGGKRVREGVGTSRRLAEMLLQKRMADAFEGRHFNKKSQGTTSFNEFAEQYAERVVTLLKSEKSERIRVLRWSRQFGARQLGQITKREIEDWQRTKRMTAKPATVNRDLCRLRHMFNKAIEWELLAQSPMKGLKFLRENNARQRYLTIPECNRLIGNCWADHTRIVVIVALHTGMRLGEILNLRPADLDFHSKSVLIRDSKNGQLRHVPMDATLQELFAEGVSKCQTEFLFQSTRSETRFVELRKSFRNARQRAGLGDLHFHDLRHTFASQFMMAGGDLYVLKEILGHKSITMTQRYAHLSPAYKRAIVDRMNNIWGLGEGGAPAATEPNSGPLPVTERSQAASA